MTRSVASTAPSSPLNSIARRPAKASIAITTSDSSAQTVVSPDAVSLLFETLAEIGMSDKEAAYTMALDPAQLSRIKTGQARMPLDAMWRLPIGFWAAWNPRVDQIKGITPETDRKETAAQIATIVRLLVEKLA